MQASAAALERALEAFDAEHQARAGARALNGVAAHHAGMLPSWKRFVEEQFIAGRLKVVFSTETLAAGLNMPARTAVLHTMSKRTGARTHATLGGNALLQMAGRAGRRGKDTMGHVVVRQSPFEGADAAIGVLKDGPEAMSSQFAVSYGMVLSLLRRLPPKRARALLERSFGNYLGGEGRRRAVLALDECEAALRAARRRAQAAPEAVGEHIWSKHAAACGRLQQEERAAALLRAQQAEATAGARADAVLAAYASGGAAVMLDLSGLQVDGADGGYVDQLPALLARASGGVSGATGARAACLGVDGAWYEGAERITALVQFAPGLPEAADAGIESPGEDSGDGVGVGEAAGDLASGLVARVPPRRALSFWSQSRARWRGRRAGGAKMTDTALEHWKAWRRRSKATRSTRARALRGLLAPTRSWHERSLTSSSAWPPPATNWRRLRAPRPHCVQVLRLHLRRSARRASSSGVCLSSESAWHRTAPRVGQSSWRTVSALRIALPFQSRAWV